MSGKIRPRLGAGTLPRGRSTFLTRTATDEAAQLLRRSSLPTPPREFGRRLEAENDGSNNPYQPTTGSSESLSQDYAETTGAEQISLDQAQDEGTAPAIVPDGLTRRSKPKNIPEYSLTSQTLRDVPSKNEKPSLAKMGSMPRPVGGTDKLDTFSGVFVPTSLNVLSILMFIRFGFVLGQAGFLAMFAMLVVAYLINLLTTMSISAIASNGTVRGGGAYYLISRSLGPEFGGSIGVVFYLGFVFNTGLNAVGLVDCLVQNFGSVTGNWATFLAEGFWWQYLWSTAVLAFCTLICLAGSSIFARASNGLLLILLIATFSIPISAIVRQPFQLDTQKYVRFTGWSLQTLRENMLPSLTKGAAGSQLRGRESFQDLFGILFPATGGIFAGASMSGDLKHPSRSIPRGTLYGLVLTFFAYSLVMIAMAASISRQSFYKNVNIVQDTNVSAILILLGECATTLFSVLMGVIGPAKLLQALARDKLIPGLGIFGQGTSSGDEPTLAILITFVAAQITMLFDINQIASFITMTYLMTFFVMNLACFLLRVSSAPNFRPSFHYFNSYTAAFGALLSVSTMYFVDGFYATGCIGILVILFLLIHFTTPPKTWGDVSQSLIYHQVRKYLLRLRTEHVKFWRPQILLFVNDPRRGFKLIQFCNSLKKGSLFILGHVIVTNNFSASVPEARRQQAAWSKYIDFTKIKAFVNVAISPSVEYGTRNVVLSAGLGGMRPNIVIMGFYNLQQFRQEQPLIDVPSPPPERKLSSHHSRRKRSRSQIKGELPTDTCIIETRMDVQSYVMILEDMILKLQINFAIAAGFGDLELPDLDKGNVKKYIDLWPIQMSAEIAAEDHPERSILTTNFDTYTLILQLGCILNTVPSWKKAYKLRVAVFVEYESDVDEERQRVVSLLDNLRIEAEVLVFWLAAGEVGSYQFIVNGNDLVDSESQEQIEKVLEDEEWWHNLRRSRGKTTNGDNGETDEVEATEEWQPSSLPRRRTSSSHLPDLRRFLDRGGKRRSFGNLSSFGISPGMRTHRLDDDMLSQHASYASSSDDNDADSNSTESVIDSHETSEDDALSTEGENDVAIDFLQDLDDVGPQAQPSTSKKSSRASSRSTKKSSKSSQRARKEDNSSTELSRGRGARPSSTSPDRNLSANDDRFLSQPRETHSRSSSVGNFSSTPMPIARVSSQEGVGPSIMFADDPHPRQQARSQTHPQNQPQATPQPQDQLQGRSIYARRTSTDIDHASTFSSPPKPHDLPHRSASRSSTQTNLTAASHPLSFNDLPSRAQHLILNDLMTLHTEDTAVIFTTLPPPPEGTYKSEVDSLRYISDLEVLCQSLGPVLMVHSNSMTVTMNL